MSSGDGIKRKIIGRKKIPPRGNRRPVLRATGGYREILIFSTEDKSHLEKTINDVFKNAKISYCYARTGKEDTTGHGHYSYHLNDLNLTGKIKNDKLIKLAQIPFDLIVDLSKNEPLARYILEKLKTSFMIGVFGNEKSYLYDLIVPETQDEKGLIDTIGKQITLLSQNGNN